MTPEDTASVSVSFVQTENDLTDPMLHAYRHGYMRPVTFLSPLVIAAIMFFGPVASAGWGGAGLFARLALLLGVLVFLGNWYLAPRWASALVLQVREMNSQALARVTVRIGPDAVSWADGDTGTTLPWGAVRSVDVLPGGISIRLGRPSGILWVPARAFASSEELAATGGLARNHFARAQQLSPSDIQWPLTAQQRKANILGAVLWLWPFVLVLAILIAYRR